MPVEVSLTGLTPFTNYSIHAAPVNNQSQVGSYSDPVVTQTEEDSESIALYIVYYIIRASNHTDSPVFFRILKLITDEKLKNTDD